MLRRRTPPILVKWVKAFLLHSRGALKCPLKHRSPEFVLSIFLVIIGAVFGAFALGFPGFVLGAGLGYAINLLLELRQRIDRVERMMDIRENRRTAPIAPPTAPPAERPSPAPSAASEPSPTVPPSEERYPEEAIIDAMQQGERTPEETAAELEEISRRGEDPFHPPPERR